MFVCSSPWIWDETDLSVVGEKFLIRGKLVAEERVTVVVDTVYK